MCWLGIKWQQKVQTGSLMCSTIMLRRTFCNKYAAGMKSKNATLLSPMTNMGKAMLGAHGALGALFIAGTSI